MPSSFADAGLGLAAASLRVATVAQAVRDVTGFAFPVFRTVAVRGAGGVPRTALAPTGAVVGTCVHPVRGGKEGEERERGVRIHLLAKKYSMNNENKRV